MYFGIDIGGTSIKYGVLDDDLNIVEQDSVKTKSVSNIEEFSNKVIEIIEYLKKEYICCTYIGIGIPGTISCEGEIIVSPNIPMLDGFNLKKYIESKIDITVYLENDSNAASLAEMYAGAGKDFKDFLYVTLGTGVGGTIISDKRIFLGSDRNAGEIGHTIIHYNDERIFGREFRRGTLEEYLGKKQIVDLMNSITDKPVEGIKELHSRAMDNDRDAIKCLNICGEILGCGLASAMNLLGIYHVVIGGGLSHLGEELFKSTRETIEKRALPNVTKKYKLHPAKFTSNAGITGAALLEKYYIDVQHNNK